MKKVVWLAILIVVSGMLSACGGGEKRENTAEVKNVGQGTTKESEIGENIVDDTEGVEETFDWSAVPVASEEDFEWEELGDGVTITGYLGSEVDIKVPATLGGKPVVGISEKAFFDETGLRSIDLTSVDLIDTVVASIGQNAFSRCLNLKRVALPDMPMNSLKHNPFRDCHSLSEITIGEGSELEIEDGMIYSGTFLILRIPAFADTDVVIREGTTNIGYDAFFCNNVVSVVMPDSVTSINESAFYACNELETITLSSNLKYISQEMFAVCVRLKEITVPEGVEGICSHAFSYCSSLESVNLPSTLTKIDDSAFGDCEALENISIPASVTSIGQAAFGSCKALENISIPASTIDIGIHAFFSCNSLTDVYYGGSEQDWQEAIGTRNIFGGTENVTVHYSSEM